MFLDPSSWDSLIFIPKIKFFKATIFYQPKNSVTTKSKSQINAFGSNNMKIAKTLVYGGSKRFLSYFSQGCNKELKEFPEIFVGTLQPGMVFTALLLDQMSDDGMKIARILGSKVEVVTPFLVKQMIKGKQTIKYLTFGKSMWRFMSSPFSKRNQEF